MGDKAITKEQTIAKALLTAMGIHFSVVFCAYFNLGPATESCLSVWVFNGAMLALVGVLLYGLVFNNDKWAVLMAPANPGQTPASLVWQVITLRTTLVFCGLLLLYHSVGHLWLLLGFIVLPTGLRYAIQTMVVSGPVVWVQSLEHPMVQIIETAKLLLSLYLLAGAPRFVRAQVKHIPPFGEGSIPS